MRLKSTPVRLIFWDRSGPLINYDGDTLRIEDLNPQVKLTWAMSRSELARLAFRALWAAVTATL